MNRLGNETSLYLRQHADNPVHWQPWDDQALREAREKDLPILLSIGYSACHWCHVMAHESFEDEATAGLMNRHYVNVKVDREERPDLDRVYQLSHQLLTGRGGGWPLTLFLDPVSHTPFYAGTYFPLEPRYGMPAFGEVLEAVQKWFHANRDEAADKGKQLVEALQSIQAPREGSGEEMSPDTAQELIQAAAQSIISRHDAVHGGYGAAPKFPQSPLLGGVATAGDLEAGDKLHRSLRFTLEQMALSGLRDHLDGGFFRYCVDSDWTIPHFEKMLYDNAQLLPLYAEGAARWESRLLEQTARGIAGWLLKVMHQPDGGFAASIDADAGGEEGGYHTWTRDQVEEILDGPQRELFLRAYGFERPPNFEERSWHLQRYRAGTYGAAPEFSPQEETFLGLARHKMRHARDGRLAPDMDPKRLCAWNALLAEGFVRAGRALEQDDWLDQAESIFSFIQAELWTGEGLLAVFNAGQARFAAYIDDYAFLLSALLQLLEARWSAEWLAFALEAADALLEKFEDADNGGFFFSAAGEAVPMARSMVFQDDATPAGAAIAARALNTLGRLVGELRYTTAAGRCISRAAPHIKDSPGAHAGFLAALREESVPPPHVVIAGSDAQTCARIKRWIDGKGNIHGYLIGPANDKLPGMLGGLRTDKPATAWLCQGLRCMPPVHKEEDLRDLLEN